MTHKCKYCQANFPCEGKTAFATKWQPCACLKDLLEDETSTSLQFFCSEKCALKHHQTNGSTKEDSENDSDSDLECEEAEMGGEEEEIAS